MKVLHINTGQEGGAAWCARRISNALVQQGVESRMLFAEGASMPVGIEGDIAKRDLIVRLRRFRVVSKFRHLLMRLPWYRNLEKRQREMQQVNTEGLYLHLPYSYYKNIAHHPLVEWADIIHLHWVPEFVDYPTFFKRVKKPIVWTLHDKHPAVGIQHYSSEFYPVPENLKELDYLCRKIKRKGVLQAKNLHIVAISEMVKRICDKSDVLKGFPCTLIHNGVDTDVFKPWKVSKEEVLSKYTESTKITAEPKIFMFSGFGIWDRNKGLERIIDALENIDCQDKALIIVGNNWENEIPQASFPLICTGLIKDQNELARLYSVSDYFISASYEETFAQTPLEAMACGTPVISTPCSGASDLIKSCNGVICDGFDSNALAAGISKALATKYDSEAIRQHIIENYSYPKIAREYINLYNQILCHADSADE